MYSSPREQKIQPMGLVGRREAISAPTVGYVSDSTPVSTAIVGPSLGHSVTMRSVRKSSQRASPMSTTHTAHSDQANQKAVRLLILATPRRPCLLVPFVTTITLPPSPSPRHSDNRYRCLMERQSDNGRRVPIHTRWGIKLRVMTTIALLLSCRELHPEPLRSLHGGPTILGGRGN